ncbi:biotin--[acetyl-CoA-carboxylase] ligase [Aurantibacter sp.]|uniref:biotin--[acetyl-CoA-carboxylase] ligase n=1 Tax=Aurantibacter sp. TaxID=2807103 RepID=UPI0035C85AED
MRIIKLNATHSTNDYLRALTLDQICKDYLIITTKSQTRGKGQMGSSWISETGKNLTFSVFKRNLNLDVKNQFLLNVVVALAIHKALYSYELKHLFVKWPNDILAEQKKICGVLVETAIKSNNIDSAILGIGLNVNQLDFNKFPKASSLKKLTGLDYDLDELLHSIIESLKYYFNWLEAEKFDELLVAYEELLFRKEKPSTFKTAEGDLCVGIIKGISKQGLLKVLFEDDNLKTFDLKEITLLY